MNDNKRIAFNSIIVFVRLVVTSVISLFASRIVLDALGASDFGLYNVVGGIVVVLNVFNNAMLATTYRFIAAELGKGDKGDLNRVFNTSFMIHAGFGLLIIILGLTVGIYYIDNYLNVDAGKLDDARFVFFISLITTVLSTMLIPFQGLITAYERFDVLAIRDIVTRIIFFIAIFLLLYTDTNRLRLYAWIQLGYNLIYNGSFFIYCKHKYKEVSSFKLYKEWKLVKEMASFALWTLFGAVASIAKSQGCVLIINFFFGTIVNAAFAVATQVENLIQQFARSLNSAAVPQITKNYSSGNQGRSIILTSYISKYTFILMTMVAFPLLVEIDFLLGLWLKEIPAGTVDFCKLMILGGLLGTLGEGIPALVNATGNIRIYQVIFHTFTLLGLPIAWFLYKLGANQNCILIVYCVIYFVNTFVRLFLLKRLYHFDIRQIVKVSYVKICIISLPLLAFYLLYNSESFSTIGHVIGLIGSELFLLLIVIIVGLDRNERGVMNKYIKSICKKYSVNESALDN